MKPVQSISEEGCNKTTEMFTNFMLEAQNNFSDLGLNQQKPM